LFFVSLTLHQLLIHKLHAHVYVELVVLDGVGDHITDVIGLRQHLKWRYQEVQLVVVGIIVPGKDGQTILGLELITVGRVVDDDDVLHGATDAFHVLDEHVLGVGAVFAKQALWRDIHWVQDVHQRVGVFRQRGSENHNLVVLADFLDEFAAVGTHLHIDRADTTLNIDGQHDVVGWRRREGRVNQGLVNVEDQSFTASHVLRLRSQQRLLILFIFILLLDLWLLLSFLWLLCPASVIAPLDLG